VRAPKKLDEITACIQDDLMRVERVLRDGMRSVSPLIGEVGDYTFDGGGKRVRPVLVLLSSGLCGYQGPRAIQIAAAAEFLHTATLVHDDVVDGAETRRGRPSVNARYGGRLAILVGDFLFATSSQLLVEDGNQDILAIYADSIRKMAEGEVLQISSSFDPAISEGAYFEIIGRKTATLIAASTESGAILADVTRSERRAVRELGWALGIAFQLVDDALDYVSTGEELGKAPLTDLGEGKITLPLLATLKRCDAGEHEAIGVALKRFASGDGSPADVTLVADAVRRYRGAELTLERARHYAAQARTQIDAFADSAAKEALAALADFIVERRT
jgi:octaprenyl-diphosphate synthase